MKRWIPLLLTVLLVGCEKEGGTTQPTPAGSGAEAPKLITRDMVRQMKPGSVIVDVAIDQGGCAETAHATTHAEPTYVVDGVVHYCVTNMPGITPRTSTFALNNATLPFVLALAGKGWKRAIPAPRG